MNKTIDDEGMNMHTTNMHHSADNAGFRSRFQSTKYWPSTYKSRFASDTKLKYNGYERDGKAIFTVTLSTFISSDHFAKSDKMRQFWVRDFLYRVTEQLQPALKEKVDYDYVIERSPEGHYHFHGLLAMPKEAGDKICNNGTLNKQLFRDLTALRTKGQYRAFAVNDFLIEPIRPGKTIDHWVHYMTKTSDYISSSAW